MVGLTIPYILMTNVRQYDPKTTKRNSSTYPFTL
jgi:hypothetical protein